MMVLSGDLRFFYRQTSAVLSISRIRIIGLMIALVLSSFDKELWAQSATPNSTLTALKTVSPITVDGNLNEPVWSQANFVMFSNPLRSDNNVRVSVLWDDANLYFAYDVTDSELEALNNPNTIVLDDGAEIYIDAANTKTITRDSNDYSFFATIGNLTKPSNFIAKTLQTATGYTMEIAIPWSAILVTPAANMTLGLLLANNDRDFGKSFQFDWLGLINSGSYNRPNLWGNLVLAAASAGDGPAPHSPISAVLVGQSGEDFVGTRKMGPDGIPDVHIRLSGVSGTISKVHITGLNGVWEMPANAQGNWLIAAVPSADPAVVDLYFDYYQTISAYQLAITYSDGYSQTVTTTSSGFDFTVSNEGDKSVTVGSSVTNVIGSSLLSGVNQAVSFSVSGLPAGATGTFSQKSCNLGCSSVLTIDTAAGTPQGSFPITVTATGGSMIKTTTFILAIVVNFAQAITSVAQTAHPLISATLLGQTGEDVVGQAALGRNGVPDVHIRLTGVSGQISNIRITGLDGIWEMPLNGQKNWLVAVQSTVDPSVVDVFLDYFKPIGAYTLSITYADGQKQQVVTSRPQLSATVLGQTGEDIVGQYALGRDGVPDVHLRLNGVSGAIANIRVTGLDGIWEMPLNAQRNWLVTTVPTSDPSVVDLYFDFYKNIPSYNVIVTYADGQKLAASTTSAVVSDASANAASSVSNAANVGNAFDFALSNSGPVSVSAGSSTANTVSAVLAAGASQQITFSVSGLPSGTLASFSSGLCNPNCSTTLNISSSPSTIAGAYPISVSATGNGLSKTTSFTLTVAAVTAGGQTYYVSSGIGPGAQLPGKDSNPGTQSQPFQTLLKAIPILKPGDTLLVRGGEYDTKVPGSDLGLTGSAGSISIIPSGTSWSNPVTIRNYPGEKPVFRRYVENATCCTDGSPESLVQKGIRLATAAECAANGNTNFPWGCWSGGGYDPGMLDWRRDHGYVGGSVMSMMSKVQYLIFDGIDFDGRGLTPALIQLSCRNLCGSPDPGYDGPEHIRFQNLEIRNSISSCVAQPSTSDALQVDFQFINVKVHHCGVPYDTNTVNGILAREHPAARFYQSFYMHSGGVLWDGIEVYKVAGAGISPLGGNNVIRNSYIHDNSAMGIIACCGWEITGNVFANHQNAVLLYDAHLSHNTFYANPAQGNFYGIYVHTTSNGNFIFENNIVYGYNYGIISDQQGGQSPIVRNNLITSNNAGREIYEDANNVVRITRQANILGQDPKFVNPSSGDYTLQPSSPAIGKANDGSNMGAR